MPIQPSDGKAPKGETLVAITTHQLDSRSQRLLQKQQTGRCFGCRKPLAPNPRDTWDEIYHDITCYEKATRRQAKVAKREASARAALETRYCETCGARITVARLRRHPTAKTCRTACSAERATQQNRAAVKRLRVRQRRVRTAAKLATLGDSAPCVVCEGEIPVQRRVQWDGIKTCSKPCAAEHQRVLVNKAKRRYRERQAATRKG